MNRIITLLALLCLTGCGQFPVGLAIPRDTRPAAVVAIEDARLQYQRERFPVLPDTLGGSGTNGRGVAPEVAVVQQPRVQFILFTDLRVSQGRRGIAQAACPACISEDVELRRIEQSERWLIGTQQNCMVQQIKVGSPVWGASSARYGITSTPTFVVRVDGKEGERVTGYQTADQILALYRKHSGPQSYQAGPRAFGAGANTRLASDWLTLPGLSLSLAQTALRVESAQTLRLNEHFAIEFKPGCQITPAADRITLTAPYPVVRAKYLFSLEAALTGIKLDSAGRKATFELSGFPDKTFSF